MPEVYEVTLAAFLLWNVLVITLFMLVFGRDVVAYFSKCGQNPVARVRPSIRPAKKPAIEHDVEESTAKRGERELVLH